MEDITPARTSRIDLLAPGDRNKPGDNRPRRIVNSKPAARNLPEPLLDADDKDEKHQLDELA